ncbi:hypothetical protein D9Q98_002511 [Chlorella vulgaris]|uniref:Alpha-1,3-mannosyl-glycoprotein 2-beta-N-acetylglucosaminyltransferase n=1 Tax=Chlorella vulgaris TaxID=3077 RepID=A0A9D4TTC1_CHLVU|nr:hypothetical protein D9Q98_002511 [Chlorella vulgaris]
MMPVFDRRSGTARSKWRYRNLLLVALLTFCAVQIIVVVTYYRRISGQQEAARRKAAAGKATASRPPRPKFVGRKEQEKLLQQSTNYSEQRVQRLRQKQDAAAAQLAKGHTPPVVGTSVFPSGNEDGECIGIGPPPSGTVAAVVVVTFNRAKYLEQMLASMLGVHGRDCSNKRKFPLYVSQDFNSSGVQDVVAQHLDRISFLQHREDVEPVVPDRKEKVVYYRIANHYKFILHTMFDCFGYDRLIILEDDMQLSPDFFSFFEATAPILDADPSLYCVSSWNDHGQDRFVSNATQLYRSDFFPGLGWMLNRRVWQSVKDNWPRGYWDDFMRLNATRQGRQCIRPEVCRTYNFGDIGSSSGQYFRLFLKPITLNTEDVRWQQRDLGFLEQGRYRQLFEREVAAAQELAGLEEVPNAAPGRDYVLRYSSQQHYESLTGKLRMLREWRDGVPRGAYRGVVAIRNAAGARILLAPTPDVDFSAARYNPDVKQRLDSTGAVIRKRPPVARTGRIQPDRTQQQQMIGAGKSGTRKATRTRQRSQQHAPANL